MKRCSVNVKMNDAILEESDRSRHEWHIFTCIWVCMYEHQLHLHSTCYLAASLAPVSALAPAPAPAPALAPSFEPSPAVAPVSSLALAFFLHPKIFLQFSRKLSKTKNRNLEKYWLNNESVYSISTVSQLIDLSLWLNRLFPFVSCFHGYFQPLCRNFLSPPPSF